MLREPGLAHMQLGKFGTALAPDAADLAAVFAAGQRLRRAKAYRIVPTLRLVGYLGGALSSLRNVARRARPR